MTEGAMSDF